MKKLAGIVLFGVTSMLLAAPLPPEVPVGDSLEHIPFKRLLADLESPSGKIRLAATRELFRRNDRVQADLKEAGARNLFVNRFAPKVTRLDMVFSLIEGADPTQPAGLRGRQFMLYVEEGVTDDDVARMGRRHGFVASAIARPADALTELRGCTCSVTAKDPVAVERAVYHLLVDEPHVVTAGMVFRW